MKSLFKICFLRMNFELPKNLNDIAVKILNTANTEDKAKLTFEAFYLYKQGKLPLFPEDVIFLN